MAFIVYSLALVMYENILSSISVVFVVEKKSSLDVDCFECKLECQNEFWVDDGVPKMKHPDVVKQKVCQMIYQILCSASTLSGVTWKVTSFWGHLDDFITVPPEINPDTNNGKKDTKCIKFNHERDFKVYMSKEFIEHDQEGALSVEVWVHKVVGFGQQNSLRENAVTSNSLVDRYNEITL
ncbi:kinesin-like protein KIF13B [Mercenaria mercenaria]|uniref:kinesin-like protein KIF13B n=1 Tax=Mercenaria mercenaria TaxID=6596 RepID=UPI00234F7DE1|nr:kinesin-like protein KIF13B [Mercenaria mercenaria]